VQPEPLLDVNVATEVERCMCNVMIDCILDFQSGLTKLSDQSINPIRYRILIRMDDELFGASLLDSICFKQNMVLYKASFICWQL
jgi:hypothetical protein